MFKSKTHTKTLVKQKVKNKLQTCSNVKQIVFKMSHPIRWESKSITILAPSAAVHKSRRTWYKPWDYEPATQRFRSLN